jgi:hypothetical protein
LYQELAGAAQGWRLHLPEAKVDRCYLPQKAKLTNKLQCQEDFHLNGMISTKLTIDIKKRERA